MIDIRVIMQEILGLVLRLLGIYLIAFSLYNVFVYILEYIPHNGVFSVLVPLLYWSAIGCAVIGFADRIVRLAYKGFKR